MVHQFPDIEKLPCLKDIFSFSFICCRNDQAGVSGSILLFHWIMKLQTFQLSSARLGVRGREVECRPCNHEVPSPSPGSGSQLWDFSLAHTFGASTGVVPRKQNQERLV